MCGIAGAFAPRKAISEHEFSAQVKAMSDTLIHRGPDADGVWCDEACGVALGHRRLSIIDLSPTGAQPMQSQCGRWVLAFNGEIYNFRNTRAKLESRGTHFRGSSDTEVFLEAISTWGVDGALKQANGMFALALWDRRDRVLHLARDRIGEKPLYYGWHDGVFLFASELKAIRTWPGCKPEIDRDALCTFLRHNYIPEPHCIFRDFRKLIPGTFVSVARSRESLPAPVTYWDLADVIVDARRESFSGTETEAVEALDTALQASVRARMVADVPLGAFLSGGIDSSSVVAAMQAQSSEPIRTFSIGFTEAQYNEAHYAKRVADHLGTAHTELYVTPEQTRQVIPRLAEIYDEPFADSSQIPTCLVSALARESVTVALSGDAGDELFAGYSRYGQALNLWQRFARLPDWAGTLSAKAIRSLRPATWDYLFGKCAALLPRKYLYSAPGDKLHKLSRLLEIEDPMGMYLRLISLWSNPEKIVRDAQEPLTALHDGTESRRESHIVSRMMYLDTVHYLPGDILTKVDRASMAVSLEARVPFLDHELIQLAWQFPYDMKMRDGEGKWVLKQVLGRYVPSELFERPKMGFGVPIDSWLRGPLREWTEDLLDEKRLRNAGYFDPHPIREVWRAHLNGAQNLQYHLWGILMFETWRERWGY